MKNFEIRKCNLDDLESYSQHAIYHLTEKGIGDIYVHPYSSLHKPNFNEFVSNLSKKWSTEPFTPNWEIAWVAIVNNKFVGHLNLRCGGIHALVHRMKLGMGLEKEFRSQGLGSALLKTAIEWAKTQDAVSWIDLSTFSKNIAARSMYKKFGFVETHIIEDALRVDNESIDDVQMVLKLR